MPLFIISQCDFGNLQRKATESGLALKPLWQDGTRTGLSFGGWLGVFRTSTDLHSRVVI